MDYLAGTDFQVSGVLGLVLLLLSITGALAGVWGYAKASSAKSRIEARDEDIEAWEERYAALKIDLEREQERRASDVAIERTQRERVEAELKTANQRIQNLADFVAAQEVLQDIRQSLAKHDETVSAALAAHDARAAHVQQVVTDGLTVNGQRIEHVEWLVRELARREGIDVDASD
jgi:flagellar biosynthesis GTPase FlhF